MDDHRLLRDGLRLLLEREGEFKVVGEAGDGGGALACLEQAALDVVVMDIHLPDEDGLQLTRRVLAARPALKILILSATPDSAHVGAAMRAGAVGFLSKEETSQELVRAIRAVLAGQVYLSPVAATSLVEHLKSEPPNLAPPAPPVFSGRELEVLALVVEGLRNKEIAQRLGVGIKSVESYRGRLMAKAGCSSPAELVRFALREKLISP